MIKKLIATSVCAVFALGVILLIASSRNEQAYAGGSSSHSAQVVLVQCNSLTSFTSADFKVVRSDSSQNAPIIVGNSSCAESLASLVQQGFKIQFADLSNLPSYTLVK